jgi:hypothetical protein
MKKHEELVCGCCGNFRTTLQPLLRLHKIVERAERRMAEDAQLRAKTEENQRVMMAAAKWVLKE